MERPLQPVVLGTSCSNWNGCYLSSLSQIVNARVSLCDLDLPNSVTLDLMFHVLLYEVYVVVARALQPEWGVSSGISSTAMESNMGVALGMQNDMAPRTILLDNPQEKM